MDHQHQLPVAVAVKKQTYKNEFQKDRQQARIQAQQLNIPYSSTDQPLPIHSPMHLILFLLTLEEQVVRYKMNPVDNP